MSNENLEEILRVLMKASNEAKVAVQVELLDNEKINIFIRPADNNKKITIKEPDEREKNVRDLLKRMEFNSELLGYRYIIEAIKILLIDRDVWLNKVVYPQIAKQYETNPKSVERVIRYSIELAWKKGKLEVLNYKGKKPTNREFLLSFLEYII